MKDPLSRHENLSRLAGANAVLTYLTRIGISTEILDNPHFDLARRMFLSKHLTRLKDLQA